MARTHFGQVDGYAIADQDKAGDPRYYGFTDVDGNYYIMEQNVASNTFRYYRRSKTSVDVTNYATDWTNRATLTYQYFYQEF